jgi:hypothetical protein
MLSGGIAEAVAYGTRLIAEWGMDGGSNDTDSDDT